MNPKKSILLGITLLASSRTKFFRFFGNYIAAGGNL
jgi:hypothetical protein